MWPIERHSQEELNKFTVYRVFRMSGIFTFLHITYFSPSACVNGLVILFCVTSRTQLSVYLTLA